MESSMQIPILHHHHHTPHDEVVHDDQQLLQPTATLTAAAGGGGGVVNDEYSLPTSRKKKRFITYKDVVDPAEYDEYLSSFPTGFTFSPTDKQLIVAYLSERVKNRQLPPNRINEVNLYKHNPEFLASERFRSYDDKEWYFFTPRDRKYKNGDRPTRAAGDGYWKATGVDKDINDDNNVKLGSKKTLVFYRGKAPKGEKTNWIMHEYTVAGSQITKNSRHDMKLDFCVLCRIYHKAPKSDKSNSNKSAAQSKGPKNKSEPPLTDDQTLLEEKSPTEGAPLPSDETNLGELDEEAEQQEEEQQNNYEEEALLDSDDLIYGYSAAGITDYNPLYPFMNGCESATAVNMGNPAKERDDAPLCPFIDAGATVGVDAVAGDIVLDVAKDPFACKVNVDKMEDSSLCSLLNPCIGVGNVGAVAGNVADEVVKKTLCRKLMNNPTSVGGNFADDQVDNNSLCQNFMNNCGSVGAGSITGNVLGDVDNSTPMCRPLNACAGGLTDSNLPVSNSVTDSFAASSTHQWAAGGYKYNSFAGFYHEQMQQGYNSHVSLFHQVHPPIRRDYPNMVHYPTDDQMQWGSVALHHDENYDKNSLLYDGHHPVLMENKNNLVAPHQDDKNYNPLLHDGQPAVFTENEADSFIIDNEEDTLELKAENFMFGGADVYFNNNAPSQKKNGSSDNGNSAQAGS